MAESSSAVPEISGESSSAALFASTSSDHSESLWKLAKTAELKAHTLEMQLQTAYVVAAKRALDDCKSTLEDVRAQRNWLDSERLSLLKQLELVVADRNQAIQLEQKLQLETQKLDERVKGITDGPYASAKTYVDTLRSELGLSPSRTLQSVFDEKSAQYLNERRLAAQPPPQSQSQSKAQAQAQKILPPTPNHPIPTAAAASTSTAAPAHRASPRTIAPAPASTSTSAAPTPIASRNSKRPRETNAGESTAPAATTTTSVPAPAKKKARVRPSRAKARAKD